MKVPREDLLFGKQPRVCKALNFTFAASGKAMKKEKTYVSSIDWKKNWNDPIF